MSERSERIRAGMVEPYVGGVSSDGARRSAQIDRERTHCSACRRRLRYKRAALGSGGGPEDWLNHSRSCRRYGEPPNAALPHHPRASALPVER